MKSPRLSFLRHFGQTISLFVGFAAFGFVAWGRHNPRLLILGVPIAVLAVLSLLIDLVNR